MSLVALFQILPVIIGHVAASEFHSSGVPDWPTILKTHSDRLAAVDSDQSAKEAFVVALGPALTLSDVSATIGAKGLPAKLTKELLLPDITASAQRLVAALAAWQLAESITRSLSEAVPPQPFLPVLPPPRLQWLDANGPFPSLMQILRPVMVSAESSLGTTEPVGDRTVLVVMAGRAAVDASQQTMAEWWRMKSWKDRVRALRGQARLCGTWQWVIHNHQQHHLEQKVSLRFPQPGKEGTGISGLSETIVLGDTVYLRWELDGRTQEDSLLFTKEGQRLEGTFVNSQGGWGSISGKRTAPCTP